VLIILPAQLHLSTPGGTNCCGSSGGQAHLQCKQDVGCVQTPCEQSNCLRGQIIEQGCHVYFAGCSAATSSSVCMHSMPC
jgi:hypothetical protein